MNRNSSTTEVPSTPSRPTSNSSPDQHAALTPPNAAESFFLSSLKTGDISAFALAAAVRNSKSSQSIKSSVAADSVYVSCQDSDSASQQLNSEADDEEEEDVFLESSETQDSVKSPKRRFLSIPILQMARRSKQQSKKNNTNNKSSVVKSTRPTPTPAEVVFETPFVEEARVVTPTSVSQSTEPTKHPMEPFESPAVPSEVLDPTVENSTTRKEEDQVLVVETEQQHFDIGSHVYEHVKGLWCFGKSTPIVQFVFLAAEAAAEKVLGVGKLHDVDTNVIQPILLDLDRSFLDPVISKVLQLVVPVCQKVQVEVLNAPFVPHLVKHIVCGDTKKNEAICEEEPTQ